MAHKRRICDGLSLAANQELLGRHVLHPNPTAHVQAALAHNVKQHHRRLAVDVLKLADDLLCGLYVAGLLGLHELLAQLLNGLCALLGVFLVGVRLLLKNLNFLVIHDLRKLNIGQAVVFLALVLCAGVPPNFDDAVFG